VGNLGPGALHEAKEYALAEVARPILGPAGTILVSLAAVLATSSAINATLFGSSRLASDMATESLAPKAFSIRNREQAPAVALIVIAVLSAMFAVFGGLDVIAAFSSMTFLLVSIGVCVANLRLRKKTHSHIAPVVAGLALMGATVVLLVIYMAQNNLAGLVFTAVVYVVTATAHVLFERLRPALKRAPPKGD
jgi:amino acid transporter